MAKEAPAPDPKQPAGTPAAPQEKAGMPMKKILMIGVPVILIQLVVVYFLIVKFFAPSPADAVVEPAAGGEQAHAETDVPQIVVIKDVIINPAGTNGSHLLVTSIGLEVPTAESKAELEQKEVQTRDILVTVLTGKRMDELTTPEQKEALRKEIQQKIDEILKTAKLRKVYFSKFIIQ